MVETKHKYSTYLLLIFLFLGIFGAVAALTAVNELKVGSWHSYLFVDYNGTLTLTGNATVYDDLRVPLSTTRAAGVQQPSFIQVLDNGAGSEGVFAYSFDDNNKQEVFFIAQLPHTWKEGSAIEPHVHWMPLDAGAGNVTWGLEYAWQSMQEVFPATTTIIYANQPAEGAYKHQYASFGGIDATNQTASSIILARLFRDAGNATDTYANDAAGLEIDFHYEKDKLGEDDFH